MNPCMGVPAAAMKPWAVWRGCASEVNTTFKWRGCTYGVCEIHLAKIERAQAAGGQDAVDELVTSWRWIS